jgi:N-acetyllactosaminide alpha-2,3-sialyltransferase
VEKLSVNVFFIRTKLQCLICQKIIDEIEIERKYIVVFLYQYTENEDFGLNVNLYKKISENSIFCAKIISNNNILRNTLKALLIVLFSTMLKGKCYLASIDSLPIAIALRVVFFCTLRTFDDGSVNVREEAKYFRNNLAKVYSKPKTLLLKILFNGSWMLWIRSKSEKHFTIFKDMENILENKKLVLLQWKWEQQILYNEKQKDYSKIKSITLGTTFKGRKDIDHIAKYLTNKTDLFLRHPREFDTIFSDKAFHFESPAEAVLAHIALSQKIRVFHFNSTTPLALFGNKNIEFINIIDSKKQKILYNIKDLDRIFF